MSYFFESVFALLEMTPLMLLIGGCVVGTIFGAIPGLTATMGVALFLPVTFGMMPTHGMALLMGVYVGGVSGGLIGATLLGIPGTPSSIATTFDAFPLAQKGQPVKALGTGIVASFIGGTVSLIALIFVAPIVARIAIRFGAFEYFSLGVCALTLVCVMSRGELLKGLTAGLLGLGLSTVGLSPIDGSARFVFGVIALTGGIGLLPMVIGIFAVPQVLREIMGEETLNELTLKVSGFGITIKEFTSNFANMIRSMLIGFGIGILPGMGGGASNLVAYAQAKNSSKHPEEFGKGCVDGIWASEAANNASIGGALVPLLTLGIPGDSVTAMLLGGLLIHGLQPGPLLFTTNPEIVHGIYAAFLLCNVIVLVLQYGGIRFFPRILMFPQRYLFPSLLVMCFIGAFAYNNLMFDIYVMLAFGAVGYLMDLYGFSLSPMVLGFVLGPIVEINLRRGLMLAQGSFMPFITRPISGGLLILAVISICLTLYREYTDAQKRSLKTATH